MFHLWLDANIHRSIILSYLSITAQGEKLSRAFRLSHCPVDLTLDVMGSDFSECARSYLNYQIRLSKFNGASAVSQPKKNRRVDWAPNLPKK